MTSLWELPIREYRENYGLTAMVETGTYKGHGVLAGLSAGYAPIVTCDLHGGFSAKPFFSPFPDDGLESVVTFFIGASTEMLPGMLAVVRDSPRALIFLDAHIDPSLFDGAVPKIGANPLPLPEELAIIRSTRDTSRDVIVIDDLQLYVKGYWIGPEWAERWGLPREPRYQSVEEITSLFPGHTPAVQHDKALVLVPR